MKTKFAASLSFIILLTGNLFSQSNSAPPTDQMMNPFWDFYATNYLNGPSAGMGNTGVASENNISGVNINPASLNMQKNRYQFSVQYDYKSTQPWLTGLNVGNINLKQNYFSGSAAFGFRVNKYFQTGVVYSNPASLYLDLGAIIQTNEFGAEIGRYDGYEKYAIQSFSVPLVFTIKKFSVGLNLNYSYFSNALSLGTAGDAVGSFGKFNGQFGVQFRPSERLSFGLAVTPELRAEFKYTLPAGGTDAGERSIYPWKLAAGVQYIIPESRLRFEADYNYARTKALDELKDRNDFNFGAEYMVNEKYSVRAGFFTLRDYRNPNLQFGDPIGNYDQYFVTIGGSMKLKKMQFDLSLLDSHISQGTIKNTYVNAGISYNF